MTLKITPTANWISETDIGLLRQRFTPLGIRTGIMETPRKRFNPIQLDKLAIRKRGLFLTSIGIGTVWQKAGIMLLEQISKIMKKFISIDDTHFPIVVARYQNFVPSADEFRQMQADLETFIGSHEDFVILIDLTDMPFMPSEFRIAQAKWSKKNDPLFEKQKMRMAFCTPSLTAQLMLKGVFLISKPAVPHAVVSTIEQGTTWGLKQMQT